MSATSKLTKRQKEVLNLIENYIIEHYCPPTRVEIAKLMGFRSPNAAEDHLKALAKKGAIELLPGTSRGIRLPNSPLVLPIIKSFAPGKPILSPENIENSYKIDKTLFQPNASFLLRINGIKMQNSNISDGDLLVVHITETAHNNQIVVVRLDNEIKIKRFHQEHNTVTLTPEDPEFQSIKLDLKKDAFKIEGVAVGVIKTKL